MNPGKPWKVKKIYKYLSSPVPGKICNSGYFDLTNYMVEVAILLHPNTELELYLQKGTMKQVILDNARQGATQCHWKYPLGCL